MNSPYKFTDPLGLAAQGSYWNNSNPGEGGVGGAFSGALGDGEGSSLYDTLVGPTGEVVGYGIDNPAQQQSSSTLSHETLYTSNIDSSTTTHPINSTQDIPSKTVQQLPPEELYHCNDRVQARLKEMKTAIRSSQGSMEYGFNILRHLDDNSIEATALISSRERDHIKYAPIPRGTKLLARVHSHGSGGLHSGTDKWNAGIDKFTSYVLTQGNRLVLYNPLEREPKSKDAPNCPRRN